MKRKISLLKLLIVEYKAALFFFMCLSYICFVKYTGFTIFNLCDLDPKTWVGAVISSILDIVTLALSISIICLICYFGFCFIEHLLFLNRVSYMPLTKEELKKAEIYTYEDYQNYYNELRSYRSFIGKHFNMYNNTPKSMEKNIKKSVKAMFPDYPDFFSDIWLRGYRF